MAGRSGATVFMVLQAALGVLLSKLGAGSDIAIGTVVAGRSEAALQRLVGFFVNTVVLRTQVSSQGSFRELLGGVRERDLSAYEHAELPFAHLVQALQPARALGRNPLFQVMLVLQNNPAGRLELPGLQQVEVQELSLEVSKFDLSFDLRESLGAPGNVPGNDQGNAQGNAQASAQGIEGRLEYSADLFEAQTAQALAQRFVRVLQAAVGQPDEPLYRLSVLSERE